MGCKGDFVEYFWCMSRIYCTTWQNPNMQRCPVILLSKATPEELSLWNGSFCKIAGFKS